MNIQVMGAGGWGIALARHLALAGHNTHLWARNPEKARRLAECREEPALLPGVFLPDDVTVAEEPVPTCDVVLYAVPSHAMKDTLERYSFPLSTIRVSTAKGIENETLLRMSERIELTEPGAPITVLSGPSHAEEVGRDLPTCVVVAGRDPGICVCVQQAFSTPVFRVYTSGDVIGVELGGALKNIIAIAAGACEGFGLGDNAKAALITRGLAEMVRLGKACAAKPETFSGLSGLGDLVVTCASRHSRNHRLGCRIAQGNTLEEILAGGAQVAEGVRAAKSARALAARHHVDMPIAAAVYETLYEGADARASITSLMSRLMKAEWD